MRAHSRLTGRTLALATAALVLACAKAGLADNSNRPASFGGVVPTSASVAAGSKARSSGPTSTAIATFTGGKPGASARGGSGAINTFRNENAPRSKPDPKSSAKGGSTGNTRAVAKSSGSTPARRPASSPTRAVASTRPKDQAITIDPTKLVVRRAADAPPPPPPAPVEPAVAAAMQTPPTPPPIDKNAFSINRMGIQP